MSAPSLYRRHRPRTFADVVGQEHVVRTLSNAIEQDKVHHAYLFVGSRGTGKTSMAKILAACLNCQGDPSTPEAERRPGPTVAPCGRCEACRSIAEATSMDVVEMDAASNNSVDDIRDLRDSVAFAPVGGRHKVYILDEAHMLSNAAWNAFLKTLEEPPPRTIFVLATTEANKVLPTVVDRCHRFDFHRPTPVQLSRVLDRVARQEAIDIGPEAVALVARHATGSFRDALGTLEQLVTYAGDDITTDDVLSVLGVADAELLFRAFDAIGAGDAAATLRVAAELAAQGRDLRQVTVDVEAHARALLLVLMTGALPDELRITPDRDERTVVQARSLSGATVIRVLDLVAGALSSMNDGADPRTQLELLLVRAALPQIDPQAKALAARIARLEQAAQGAAPPPPPAIPVAAPAPPAPGPAAANPAAAAPSPTVTPPSPVTPPAPGAAPSPVAPPSPVAGPGGPGTAPVGPGGSGTAAAVPRHDERPGAGPSGPTDVRMPGAAPVPPRGDVGRAAPGDLTPGAFQPRPESAPRTGVDPQGGPLVAPEIGAPTPSTAAPVAGTPSAGPTPPVARTSSVAPTPPVAADPTSPVAGTPSAAPSAATTSPVDAPVAATPSAAPVATPPVPPSATDGPPVTDAPAPALPVTDGRPAPEAASPVADVPAPDATSVAPAPPAPDASTAAAPPVGSAPPAPSPATPAPVPPAVPVPATPVPATPVPVGLTAADVDEQLPGIAERMSGAVRAALGQARAASVSGTDLVLGVPAGKGTAARTINREDAKERIAAELEELLGVRFVVRAEEQAGVEAKQEPLLPEDEVVRRVMTEFEAEEVGDGASGVPSPTVQDEDASSAPETPTRTHGEP